MMNKFKNITVSKITIFLFVLCIELIGVMNLKGLVDYYVYEKSPVSEWKPEMGDKLEADYSSVFWGKMQYVNLNGFCRKILHQREMNGVIKLNNGYLAEVDTDSNTDIVIHNAQNVGELSQWLEQNDIELLYVVTPDTISKYDMQLPEGIHDYTNQKLDRFVEQLEEENVQYIDLRECIYEDGISQYDYFYKTDHHWNVRGGMYAAEKITEAVGELLEVVHDDTVWDDSNYQIDRYFEWHLGSRGQRVGRYFVGIDDFEIMYPKFETKINRKSDDMTGSFRDIFISYDALDNKNYASRYTYDRTYDCLTNRYINENALCNKKACILSDSMGRVVIPYLSLVFSEVDSIEEMTKGDIEKSMPDIVVILLHPMNVKQADYFDFGL